MSILFRVKWCNDFWYFLHIRWNGEIIICCIGDMEKWYNGEMGKWWRKSIVQWIMWWDLTVTWVISSDLVSLILIQHPNDIHPDYYGEAHLCYLWCLLFYLILCLVNFPFLRNGELMWWWDDSWWCSNDGEAILLRQIFHQQFALWSEFFHWTEFCPSWREAVVISNNDIYSDNCVHISCSSKNITVLGSPKVLMKGFCSTVFSTVHSILVLGR